VQTQRMNGREKTGLWTNGGISSDKNWRGQEVNNFTARKMAALDTAWVGKFFHDDQRGRWHFEVGGKGGEKGGRQWKFPTKIEALFPGKKGGNTAV